MTPRAAFWLGATFGFNLMGGLVALTKNHDYASAAFILIGAALLWTIRPTADTSSIRTAPKPTAEDWRLAGEDFEQVIGNTRRTGDVK